MHKISVVIRNKNQAKSLSFLLKNLTERYSEDISEIIVLDNLSTDSSVSICQKYKARVVTIEKFGYGSSANLAAATANHTIVVIFSAHAYPVSHDFFKLIKIKFSQNPNLAGLRCLHNKNDFKHYINNVSAKNNPKAAGVIFCGSAFSKQVWEAHNFKNDIRTLEDKEWSKRVLNAGFDIEFVPSIFCYDIKRSKSQLYFRFKNELIGGYQLWHTDYNLISICKNLIRSILNIISNCFSDLFYAFKRFLFSIHFLMNKPDKF